MTFLLAALAQLLHIALMLAAAPVLIGLQRWGEAAWAGRAGPPPWQPWLDMQRLFRKQPVVAENAAPLSGAVPLACFAAMAVAAFLIPSFTRGMAFAPLSDLLVLAGLLALDQMALALAALEPGTARAGLAAARATSRACLAEPALFLAILTLGAAGGTTNLDRLIGLQLQGMLQPVAAIALVGAALAALALAAPDRADQVAEFSGADLALLEMAGALRRLVWFDLIGAVFLPFGMAQPGAGLLAWVIGLLCWAVKALLLSAGWIALRCATGHLRPAGTRQALGIATALGLLAALLVLGSAVAA